MKKIVLALLFLTVNVTAEWEFNQDFSHSAEAIKKVTIDCPIGIIECEPSSDNNTYVYIKKISFCDDSTEAEKLVNDCRVDFNVINSKIEIIFDLSDYDKSHRSLLKKLFSKHDEHEIDIHCKILLPAGIDYNVETASADIYAADLENKVTVEGASSDVCLENITGDCSVHLASGDLEAVKIAGEIDFSGASSDFQIEDIKGDMKISTASGDGLIETVRGNVDLGTSSGDIQIFGLKGDLKFRTSSGDVRCSDISGFVDGRSTSGTIKIKQLKNENGIYNVEAISGDIFLELPHNFAGSLEIGTVSGDIDTQIDMNIHYSSSKCLKGDIGSGSGRIQIETVSGDVMLEEY